MADHGRVNITPEGGRPQGTRPSVPKAQIKQWLDSTDPGTVQTAGQAYKDLASKVQAAADTLETHARKILQAWQGPDAARARTALELLHATGNELSTKMDAMGGALQTYVGHLNTAKTEVERDWDPIGPYATEDDRAVAKVALNNTLAQRALEELNQKIVAISTGEVPQFVEYDLPTVNIPGGPPATQDPGYPTGTDTNGPTFGRSATDYSGGGSNGDTRGSGPGDSGGSNPGGSNPGGSNPGGSDPGGSNPGGSDPGGSDPGQNPQDPPPTQPPGQPQVPGSDNGTVPPVIGGDGQTVTDGTNGTDPRQTDMAAFQPTTAITTPFTTVTPPGSFATTTPPNLFTPTPPGGGSPIMPSVIGSPVIGGGPGAAGAAGGRLLGGGATGMPMMPFMGGAAGAPEHGDMERTTFLTEDASAWTTRNDTTDPVIG
ncbi:WXG100 family type VII secretion target [Nonomuraea jiangxiensis]|uniref:Outer membrane channel protein CpnT-like N-terminal domain-containing protein n=1 Tax=Nonomuraea jiangxiensis TaxID=633440 RepID=A0A1G8FIN2_9ACTN|nr:WXG100 family type VII secretion target [Nonomuraea jiangxiensis]SDH82014.1 hypothetical protein SAMN05421869_103331 [Nonomuraea jiangxiensis]